MIPGEGPWFVAFPDVDDSLRVVRALRELCPGAAELPHPSGRPWIVGRFAPWRIAVGHARGCAVALIGEHAVTDAELAALAARVRRGGDLADLYARVPGSVHLVGSCRGATRVQGTASGLRRVHHGSADGVPVAGDQAHVVARLVRARVDPARLAARLLFPGAPWPLAWQPAWDRAVRAVPPGWAVVLRPWGGAQEVRWWTPPVPGVPAEAGAQALREALAEAVRARVAAAAGRPVVAHLGGPGSAAVCSLAVREGAEVVALTADRPGPVDDDAAWARRAAAGLRRAGYALRHDAVSAAECPPAHAGPLDGAEPLDEPFGRRSERARFGHLLARGVRHRPLLHLTGAGADAVTRAGHAWLRELLRAGPRAGLRSVRAAAAHQGWPLPATLAALARVGPYPRWLEAVAADLARDAGPGPDVGWGPRPVLAPWVTRDAAQAVAGLLREAAREAREPGGPALAAEPGAHRDLAAVHAVARATRGFQYLAARQGELLSAPFLDDRVLAAALSVEVTARHAPRGGRPLLAAAMRGVLPGPLPGGRPAPDTAAATPGGRAARDRLAALAEDSRLARMGLVDAGALRAALLGPADAAAPPARIEPAVTCELWLRAAGGAHRAHVGG
ncbi:hypothetical protein GCM10027168_50860 [Streptomyces capparidis]